MSCHYIIINTIYLAPVSRLQGISRANVVRYLMRRCVVIFTISVQRGARAHLTPSDQQQVNRPSL